MSNLGLLPSFSIRLLLSLICSFSNVYKYPEMWLSSFYEDEIEEIRLYSVLLCGNLEIPNILGHTPVWMPRVCWALIIHWVVVIVEQRHHFNHVIDPPPSCFRFQEEIRNLGPGSVGAQKFIPSKMT